MTNTRAQLAAAVESTVRNDLHAPTPVPAGVIASHVIDVLLSLPRVAIVGLPDKYDYGWNVPSCGEFNGVESTGDSVISVEINSYGIEAHTLGEMTPLEARLLAAALLAAVNAAEREAK